MPGRNAHVSGDLYGHFANFYGQSHVPGAGLHVTPTSNASEYGIGLIGSHQPRAVIKAEHHVEFPDLDNSWNGCDRSTTGEDDDDIRSSKRRKVSPGESASPVTSNEHSPEQTVPHGLNAANASISFYGAPPYPAGEANYGYYGSHGYYSQQPEPLHTGSGY